MRRPVYVFQCDHVGIQTRRPVPIKYALDPRVDFHDEGIALCNQNQIRRYIFLSSLKVGGNFQAAVSTGSGNLLA